MAHTQPSRSKTYLVLEWFVLVCCIVVPAALAQSTHHHDRMDALNQLNLSIQALAARVENPYGIDTEPQAGDPIYGINGNPIPIIDALQAAARQLKPGDPVALFIERAGKLQYGSFQPGFPF
jgi:S1-C subfamily serine protease